MSEKTRKTLNFCYGFFGMIAVIGCIYLFDTLTSEDYKGLLSAMCTIPLALVAILLWGIFRKRNKMLALGFLFGGIAPLLTLFVMSGGCGLIRY